jgi:hypothetical protein
MGKVWRLEDAGLMLKEIEGDVKKAASAGLLAAAHRTVAHIVANIIPGLMHPPVDRGLYRAGWRARKDGTGAVVENVAPHAIFIEYGVRAGNVKIGRAMIEALAAWVKRKGIGGRTVTGKSGKTRHIKATNTEAESIAWAIAKSMQKHGIFAGGKGLGVLKEAEKSVPRFIREEVGRELARVGHKK